MKRLFINHRTDDDQSTRERLLGDLERRLAPGQVFIDRKGIEPGEGWENRISKEIESADVVFALIGPAWLTVCDATTRVPRIRQRSDWVRYEIEVSLKRGDSADFVLVPLLLGSTTRPTKKQLPKSLHGLAGRQASTLRLLHEEWDRDIDALIALLVERGFQKLDTAPKSPPQESRVPPELEALLKERSQLQIAGQDTAALDVKLRAFNAQRLRGPLLQPGYTFANNYVLEEQIGQGGFSSVWRAWDRQAGRHVAIKVLHPNQSQDRSARERFERGAKAMGDLQHEHIVRVFTPAAEQDEFWWFAMEYVPGRDLRRAVLDDKGRPDRATLLRILRDVAEALDYAHSKHVIHRDVKPANILVDQAGRAKLTDFDLVKLPHDTQLTVAIGDAWFAAPEVRDEEGDDATPASDVYSLAMTVLYALTGGRVVGKRGATVESLARDAGFGESSVRATVAALSDEPAKRSKGAVELMSAVVVDDEEPRARRWWGWVAALLVVAVIVVWRSWPDRRFLQQEGGVSARGADDGERHPSPSDRRLNEDGLTPQERVSRLLSGLDAHGFAEWLEGQPADARPEVHAQLESVVPEGSDQIGVLLWVLRQAGLPVERESFFARARRKVIPVPKEWFKKIERGRFEMGSPDTEAEQYDNEGPTRYVEIGEFEIFTREVTNEQMVAFDKSFQPQEWSGVSSEELPRHPAVKVSWWAAYAYCAWIGARLPSEAEWEYACRAGTKTPFSFGDTIAVEQVNYDGSYPYGQGKKGEYRKRTVPVASLPANPWGLFEMHGNVWEWCEDTYQDTYEKAPTDGSAWVMKGDRFRVLRGGSWDDRARWCRSACRIRRPASARFDCVGFRPARFTTK